MFYIKANGIKIAANCHGDPHNPAVVLNHGGISTGGMKGAFSDEFKEELAKEYFVVEYDRRCNGYTGYPESFTFEEQADDVVAVMDALCVEKAALIGISAGTYVGGRSIIKHTERFSCAVFIAGSSHDAGGLTPAAAYFKKIGVDVGSVSPNELLQASFAPMTSQETIKAFLESSSTDRVFTPEQTARGYTELAYWDNRPGFKEVDIPVLVITGKYDKFNSPEIGKEMAGCLKNGKYLEFEFSAHAPTNEEPERGLKEIRAFLNDQKPW